MRLWIGHYANAPSDWFLAWGGSREEVGELIRMDLGEPDLDSIKPVRGKGYFAFRAQARRRHEAWIAELEPPEGERLVLYDPSAEEWILRRLTERPLAPPPDAAEAPGAPSVGLPEGKIPRGKITASHRGSHEE